MIVVTFERSTASNKLEMQIRLSGGYTNASSTEWLLASTKEQFPVIKLKRPFFDNQSELALKVQQEKTTVNTKIGRQTRHRQPHRVKLCHMLPVATQFFTSIQYWR